MTPPNLNANQKTVLDLIWRHGPIPRVDISPMTDLSSMTVTRVTKELSDQGLLLEEINRSGARGQPKRPLVLNADAAFAGGVYFSERNLQVGLVDLGGRLIDYRRIDTPADKPRTIASTASDLVDSLITEHDLDTDKLVGIGFALPGDFIFDRKRLNAHALFPGFRGEDLLAEFQSSTDYKVYIENDAASAALGERLMGIGQTINHFFFAHVGHGIGGGLVINGELYRGAKGNAGIIGVQFPNDEPRPSGQDLFDTLRSAEVEVSDFSDLEDLRPQTCPPLKRWITRAARQLRQSLWITARILDPDAIIIGGRLPAHLLQEIVARIDDESFCNEGVLLPRPKVFASSLASTAGVVGAASVPLHRHYFGAAI